MAKKKRYLWLLAGALAGWMQLYGCADSIPPDALPFTQEETAAGSKQYVQAENIEPENTAAPAAALRTPIQEKSFYYGYSVLDETGQQLYREILASLLNREADISLSVLDEALVEPVFRSVMADHPEIFYVDGYTVTTHKLGGELKKLLFRGSFTMPEEEIVQRTTRIEETLENWLSGLSADMDDYEKAKYLYEFLIRHTDYEKGAVDNQNICSVLLNGSSVCQGYAKAWQLLCQRADIPALMVSGTVDGQGHAWDLVCLDGEWYHVDPTWGDASWLVDGSQKQEDNPEINYDYFCVTDEQILRTHGLSEAQILPPCTAVSDNYYRREGLYLTSPDQLEGIFDIAAAQNRKIVAFQCADDSTYDTVYDLLITDQKIFDYLPSDRNTVSYADKKEQRVFCFWLKD